MSDLLDAGAAIVWLAAIYQASIVWRGGGDSATRWHVLGFAALAVALTVNLTPVYHAVDQSTRVPNLGELLTHGFALLAAWCAHAAIVASVHAPAGFRRRMTPSAVALAAALTVMTFCFIAAPVDREVTEFTVTYAAATFVAPYFLAYLAFAGFALVDIGLLGWRYRGSAGALGLGLRVLMLGAACGLVYVVQKAVYVILARWSDVQLDAVKSAELSHVALVLCAILCVTGATLPRWGATALRLPALVREYRSYQRLRRLWTAVTDACPDVVLGKRRRRWIDTADFRAIELRLYRRIIEVRDCQLELRPYVDVDIVAQVRATASAHGLTGAHLDALTEATALRVAVERKKRGRAGHSPQPAVTVEGPTDLTSEADRLVLVSRYFDAYDPPEWLAAEERACA